MRLSLILIEYLLRHQIYPFACGADGDIVCGKVIYDLLEKLWGYGVLGLAWVHAVKDQDQPKFLRLRLVDPGFNLGEGRI